MARVDELQVLSVLVWGLLGGVQVTAVGRCVVARGLSSGQAGPGILERVIWAAGVSGACL